MGTPIVLQFRMDTTSGQVPSLYSGELFLDYPADVVWMGGCSGSFPISPTSGTITSGMFTSGLIAALGSATITSGQVTSGFLGTTSVSPAVSSGNVASGQLDWMHHISGFTTSGLTLSGAIGSGQIGSPHIATNSIVSGKVQQYAVVGSQVLPNSGQIASGSIGTPDIGITAIVPYAQTSLLLGPTSSGVQLPAVGITPVLGESFGIGTGDQPVCVDQSGFIIHARAAVSGRMPAIGILLSGPNNTTHTPIASPIVTSYFSLGTAGVFSGYENAPIYVGRSGGLVLSSGSFNSGGFVSGDFIQQVGVVLNNSGCAYNIGPSSQLGVSIVSGNIGSGAITGQDGGGVFNIASGTIGTNDIGSGQITAIQMASGSVLSGSVGSGQISSGMLASGLIAALGSATLTSGQIVSGLLATTSTNAPVNSGNIGSGQIGLIHCQSGFTTSGLYLSGSIGSGQITTVHIASGTKVDFSEHSIEDTYVTAELISGIAPVAFNLSGEIIAAWAQFPNSGRVPAIGLAIDNIASGQPITIYTYGRVYSPNLLYSGGVFSGNVGPLYVGRSGGLSNSFLGSNPVQSMGVQTTNSGLWINVGPAMEAVSPLAFGTIGNGIQTVNLTGIIKSGTIGSGSVTGQQGGGFFSIASGTIGTNDIGSGQVQSGNIASGTIASGMLASGLLAGIVLTSGQVQSGNIGNNAILSGNIASGIIASGMLASGLIASINVSILSGTIVEYARETIYDNLIAGELISGIQPIAMQSGLMVLAASSGFARLPAIGIAVDNISSGQAGKVYTRGYLFDVRFGSGWFANSFSGQVNAALFVHNVNQVGISNPLTLLPGGHIWQRAATWINGSGILINPGDIYVGSSGIQFQNGDTGSPGGGVTLGPTAVRPFIAINGVVSGMIANNAVSSGSIASGQIGNTHIASGTVVSGGIGNAAVVSGSISSGTQVSFAYNAYDDSFACVETVSGQCPVCILSGGFIGVANGGSGLRMPAIGVAAGNYLSGANVQIIFTGKLLLTSGMYQLWSGQYGVPLYVSKSGGLITPVAGITGVSTQKQRVGWAISGGLLVQVGGVLLSGNMTYGSGNI